MTSGLTEIESFIAKIPPFDLLPEHAIELLVKHIEILYLRSGEPLPPDTITKPSLFVIRKGLLAYFEQDSTLIDKYGEQDLCTIFVIRICNFGINKAISSSAATDFALRIIWVILTAFCPSKCIKSVIVTMPSSSPFLVTGK